MKHRNPFFEMNGREILNSFGELHHHYLFDKIQNLRSGLEKKFHRCSTEVDECVEPDLDSICITDLREKLKELRDKKLPYKLYVKIVWFLPSEESDYK